MKRRILGLLFLLFFSFEMYATTFSVPDESGIVYNSKGECMLFYDMDKASVSFSDEIADFSNVRCSRIVFGETKIDTFVIENNYISISSDKQTVTLKSPIANSGYLFEYDVYSNGDSLKKTAFTWITKFEPLESLIWTKDSIYCEELDIDFSPVLTYKTKFGETKKIIRNMTISYNTLTDGENGPSENSTQEQIEESNTITISPVPYVNTTFVLSDFTIESQKYQITSDTFITQAVVAFPTMTTTAKFLHEGDEGIDSTLKFSTSFDEAISLSGNFRSSGPLLLNLISNSSDLANHFEWAVTHGVTAEQGDFSNAFVLFEKDINSYEVADPGLYCFELTVSNIRNDSVCENKSYACFSIAESQLNIPNAFTPNGDGTNDEFRVAYRSIASFNCHIYDQWGRKVYESTDITKGWDGYVGNRIGDIGTYFYYIEAVGTDGVEYKKKGSVNLIRTKD